MCLAVWSSLHVDQQLCRWKKLRQVFGHDYFHFLSSHCLRHWNDIALDLKLMGKISWVNGHRLGVFFSDCHFCHLAHQLDWIAFLSRLQRNYNLPVHNVTTWARCKEKVTTRASLTAANSPKHGSCNNGRQPPSNQSNPSKNATSIKFPRKDCINGSQSGSISPSFKQQTWKYRRGSFRAQCKLKRNREQSYLKVRGDESTQSS